MTEWKFTGERPPLSEADWEAEFAKYKKFPEYQKLRRDMTLAEFKFIFLMEYAHRMLGRTIGLAFLLPAVYFAARGRLPGARLKLRVAGIFSLICGQGVLGWWMVKSGLEAPPEHKTPRVSPYRLAAHLLSAFVIYGATLNTAFRCWAPAPAIVLKPSVTILANIFPAVLAAAIAAGVFVAGNHAGLVYNEFPWMGEGLIPKDLIDPSLTALRNLAEHPPLVQFNHRVLAEITWTMTVMLWIATRGRGVPRRIKTAGTALAVTATAQAGLGIVTLLNHVPICLAATHQAGALTLFSIAVWLRYLMSGIQKGV